MAGLASVEMNRLLPASRLASITQLAVIFIGIATGADTSQTVAVPSIPSVRAERIQLDSGADLITVFERLPADPESANSRQELPLVAILKDTLDDSDPSNDRLRQVWIFTYSQPSIWQRAAGGIPFLYHRAGLDTGPGSSPPRAVLDLGDPSRGMWAGLGVTAVQSEVLNPIGALARLTTHSFFGNYGEYRKTHIWEADDVLSTLLPACIDCGLTGEEIAQVQERLALAGLPLGGLVPDEDLGRDHEKERLRQTETRGHNWELLRQCAEDAGLYLEDPEASGLPASIAVLWVAQPDVEDSPGRKFDRKFLNISNPFSDRRLRNWDGYSETWNLDRNGVPVDADAPGSHPVKMIPLALYGLDHPHSPLLLVDFRGSGHPPRREIGLKIAEDVTSGVLGLTGVSEVALLSFKFTWMFVQKRHGAATDRSERRRAFVSVRHAVGSDSDLEANFRAEILSRLEKIDVNPLERPWDQEIRDAWRQYDALIADAEKTGLAREIDKDRGDEISASVHGTGARILQRLASIGTAGLYRHHDSVNPALMAKLDQQRRDAWLKTHSPFLPPAEESPFEKSMVARQDDSVSLPDAAPTPAKAETGQ